MKILDLNQGSPEWHDWRRRGIGGSDIAAAVGVSPYEDATRERVILEKLGRYESPQNGAMYRGIVLEPHARAMYTRRTRHRSAAVCIEHESFPWARASLDGLCTNGAPVPGERLEWILELKCPGWETHSRMLSGIVPEHFEVQCQWQMWVAGLDLCDLVSFNPSSRFTPTSALPWKEWRELAERDRPKPPADWLTVTEIRADIQQQMRLLDAAMRLWEEVECMRDGVATAAG